MTEIETYTIRMDEEENPMLEQITRGGKKTQKAYSKRLDALYNLLGEKEKLISGHVRKSLEWCDKRSKVSREAKKPYNDLEADALKDLETRLRKELPEDAIASMLKDVGSVNQVRAYNLLPHYRDDIIDSLSPADDDEREIYERVFDHRVDIIKRIEEKLADSESYDEYRKKVKKSGKFLGFVGGIVILGSYFGFAGFLVGWFLGDDIGEAIGAGISRPLYRAKVKNLYRKELKLAKEDYLKELMELE